MRVCKQSILGLSVAIFAAAFLARPALSEEYKFGDVSMTLDNTVSASVSVRTSDQNCEYISVYNGGCTAANGTDYDVNSDDGNINVERGDIISAPIKIVSEIDAKWREYGVFARAKAFWNPAAYKLGDGDGNYGPVAAPNAQRRPLQDAYRGDDAYNRELRQLKLLDAFAYANFNVFDDLPLNVRLGRQVVNWGESLFIPGGVSSYLPLDVAALTKPGTELKEVFLPQLTAYASLGLPANFTVEAMYIAAWEKSPLPPCGTFFSPSDALSDGCGYALASGEFYTNPDGSPRDTSGTTGPLFVPRGASDNPPQQGQWGAALRYYADWLNDGTDLGAYFVNFHDKLPIGTFTANANQTLLNVASIAAGGNPSSPLCLVALPFSDDAGRPVRTCAGAEGLDAKLSGKTLRAQYPDNIHMIGASFNTTVNILNGTALSGDLAYYTNMPFQIDTTELTGADFRNAGFLGLLGQPSIYNGPAVAPGDLIPGYQRTTALHGQVYTISTFTPSDAIVSMAGADILLLVANAGFQYLPDAKGNRFMIPRSGETHPNPGMASILGDPCIAAGSCSVSPQYATSFSWGYRVLAALQYNSAFGTPYTIMPRVFFSHDMKGYSAGPIGPGFIEGVKRVGIGADFSYKSAYKVSVDYSTAFGNAYRNAMYDKDFASASFSYAF
ncbi:DUF1302 domain-containing protein [Parvibaculum sp.]|uniref:DUF1302 domain-containing protein n=1 Tax=Parvibaculum sp. TaxID=2024848 RepID=UPI002C9C327D|nr:DUF1302 domain-containing protein [Parvibaculum sp.]HUD52040.1 DUF1302 domain-containing protein [Parvibaculum sp.]